MSETMTQPELEFQQRTDWAESFVAQLARQPLISECVYHSPQRLDVSQKEVVDILLVLAGRAILLSLKCQEKPGSRPPEKEVGWVAKAAAGAARQIHGALRAMQANNFWCEHPHRGRVEFSADELRVTQAVVLVESVNATTLASDLPLSLGGIPVSYFTVNDFCNILQELRTIPEIEAYLDARHALPLDALRLIGEEKALYEYYLLNNETFTGCLGQNDARLVSAVRAAELCSALARKAEADKYAGLIEHVADCLAERNPKYLDGLPEGYQDNFDASTNRKNYLRMQEELCDLGLAGRSLLGQHFAHVMDKAEQAKRPAMTYAAVHNDEKPDIVYVFVSGRGEPRLELLERAKTLILGAIAFYEKRRGMAIVDRDSVSFEVFLFEVPSHSITEFHVGERLFGQLSMAHIPATLVPQKVPPH